MRSIFGTVDAENYHGILIFLKGDGQTYQLRLPQQEQFDGVAFYQPFETVAEKWLEIFSSFDLFKLATEKDFYQITPSLIKEKFLKLD